MKNKISAREFEQTISRIHKSLEKKSTKISWNKHIKDPNTPKNRRQIDIILERDGRITHIECRHHTKKQGSPWVEALYGRKVNLNVDTMIGVSSSGFTKSAINTAKKLGIILKDLKEVTALEAEEWGSKTLIIGHFIEFKDAKIEIVCEPPKPKKELDEEEILNELEEQDKSLSSLTNLCSHHIYKIIKENSLAIGTELEETKNQLWIKPRKLKENIKPYLLTIFYTPIYRVMSLEFDMAALYGPAETHNKKDLLYQKYTQKNWEARSTKEKTQVQIDLESLTTPDNYAIVEIQFQQTRNNKTNINEVTALGLNDHKNMSGMRADVNLVFEKIKMTGQEMPTQFNLPTINLGQNPPSG